jgi:hypothetical protein
MNIPKTSINVLLVLIVCAPLRAFAFGEDFKSYRDIKITPEIFAKAQTSGATDGVLRADADEIADLLHVRPLVAVIRTAKAANTSSTSSTSGASSTLVLSKSVQQARMLCLYKIMIASQETRKTIAIIDYEIANTNVSLSSLNAKRQAFSNTLNTSNFMQGGTAGVVKQSLSFPGGATAAPRQEIAMASFGTSIALALINLLSAGAWHRPIDSKPNTLAFVFDGARQPSDANQSYLWKFLSTKIPGSSSDLTRRALLVKHFQAIAGVNPADEIRVKRITATPPPDKELNESIRILNQRIDLLHDLKTHVEEFDGSLYEFHRAIQMND